MLSVGNYFFSRQEYQSGLPFLSPGHLPDPGIKPGSPAWQADSLLSEPQGKLSDNYWRIANQNYNEVSLTPVRMAIIDKSTED